MPLPNPKKYENEDNYISACMKAQENEDKPHKQKLAICFSKWEKKDEEKSNDLSDLLASNLED